MDQNESEKVLIERDGKFELVNASDMKAVETNSLQQGQNVLGGREGREGENGGPLSTESAPRSVDVNNDLQTGENKQTSPHTVQSDQVGALPVSIYGKAKSNEHQSELTPIKN